MTTDLDLDRRLRALAVAVEPPPVHPTEDLARGRQRLVRRRLTAAGASLGVAAAVAVGIVLVPGSKAVDPVPAPSTQHPKPTATPSTQPTLRASESPQTPVGGDDVFVAIRRATAEHLDPHGTHISAREINNPNRSGSFSGAGAWVSVVQKVGWTNPGEPGLGLVTVGVSRELGYDCGGGHGPGGPVETCTHTDLAGTPVVRVDDPASGGTTYVHRRDDGYFTSVSLSNLYGNNSTVAVSGIDVTPAQLAGLLTDPVLDIPGHPAPIPPDAKLTGRELRDITRAAVGGEHLRDESWAGDTGGYYQARWYDGGAPVGELMVQEATGNFGVHARCAHWFSTRCEHRTVGGIAVRVDHRTHRTGDGYDVTVAGSTRPVWIRWDPVDPDAPYALTVDEAIELALDPAFQR